MKRLTGLAIVIALLLAALCSGHVNTVFAKEKDAAAILKDASEILGDEGAVAFWRAGLYLNKMDETGALVLKDGLDDKDPLVRMACARRMLEMYKGKGDTTAKVYNDKSEKVILAVATDEKAETDARVIAVEVLGVSGRPEKVTGAVAKIAADKGAEAALRLAAAEAEYMLGGELKQKEFVEGILKGEDFRLRLPAAALLYMLTQSEAAANVLQDYRNDLSIEGLLANRMLANTELKKAISGMTGVDVDPAKLKEEVAKLEKEYDQTFEEAADITARVKALRAYIEGMQEQLEEAAKAKDKPKEGEGGGTEGGEAPGTGAGEGAGTNGGENGGTRPAPASPAGNPPMFSFISSDNTKPPDAAAPPVPHASEKAKQQFDEAVKLLNDTDIAAFWEAFKRMVALDKAGAELFTAGLADESNAMKQVACAGALLKVFAKDKDEAAFKASGDPVGALWKIIKDEKRTSEVRQVATDILGKYGKGDNSKDLLDLANNAIDPFVCLCAIRASYYQTGKMLRKDFLIGKLSNDDLDVVAWAMITLCEMEDYDSARPAIETLRYEPTVRGRLVQQYVISDAQAKKMMKILLGPPELERIKQLKIDIERFKAEIKARKVTLDETKEKALAQVALMKKEDQAQMKKDIEDIYNGVKTEGGEEEAPPEAGTSAPPASGTTPPAPGTPAPGTSAPPATGTAAPAPGTAPAPATAPAHTNPAPPSTAPAHSGLRRADRHGGR